MIPQVLVGPPMFHVMALSHWRDTITGPYRKSVFLGGALPRHTPACVLFLSVNNPRPEGNGERASHALLGLWAALQQDSDLATPLLLRVSGTGHRPAPRGTSLFPEEV